MLEIGPLMISLEDAKLSVEEEEYLNHEAIGGVILFKQNYKNRQQLIQLTKTIKSINPDIIIACDHEGGRVQRLIGDGFKRLPPMATLGVMYEQNKEQALNEAYRLGSIVSAQLLEVHIDLSFSPVLDVNIGESSVIGNRALHASPEVIAQIAESFIKGLHANKMLSVAKHFPGHGSVKGDTHNNLVMDKRKKEEIMQQDMLPYRQLITSNVLDAVMTAHVIYPDADKNAATCSKFWLEEILRKELNFKGIIFSDDLSMLGIREIFHHQKISTLLDTGCDMLILCHDSDLIKQAINEFSEIDIRHYRQQLGKLWGQRKLYLTQ